MPFVRPTLTPELAASIAAALRADDKLSVTAASIDAGISPGTVAAAMHAFRYGKGSEVAGPIVRAVEAQCEALIAKADDKDHDDRPTSYLQWRLETKLPSQYGRRQAVEVAGKDGEAIEFRAVQSMSVLEIRAEMAQLAADATKDGDE